MRTQETLDNKRHFGFEPEEFKEIFEIDQDKCLVGKYTWTDFDGQEYEVSSYKMDKYTFQTYDALNYKPTEGKFPYMIIAPSIGFFACEYQAEIKEKLKEIKKTVEGWNKYG